MGASLIDIGQVHLFYISGSVELGRRSERIYLRRTNISVNIIGSTGDMFALFYCTMRSM